MSKSRVKPIVLAVLVGIIALSLGFWLQMQQVRGKRQPNTLLMQDNTMALFAFPKKVGEFTLLDHNRQTFSTKQLRGKWTFIFFGYTYCPDVCPSTMFMMASVEQGLVKKIGKHHGAQFVFVSVDPERDTPKRLAEYVPNFHKQFIGVSGKPKQIKKITGNFGVAYELLKEPGKKDYLVNHTAAVFLVGPKGHYRALFPAPHKPKDIVERFAMVRQLK